MRIPLETWESASVCFKAKILSKFDPSTLVPPIGDLQSKLHIDHKGFFICLFDSSKKKIVRTGFMEDGQSDIVNSATKAIDALHKELEANKVSYAKLLTAVFNFVVVWDVVYLKNSLGWNENDDGVYFSWGDEYKGFYVPSEIKQMKVPKTEILNRLCSFECHVPSNLWRLPEGLVSRIVCDSFG
jgi:hypothetical protein